MFQKKAGMEEGEGKASYLLSRQKIERCKLKQEMRQIRMTQKTLEENRELLSNAKVDFESVEIRALNDFLPKIFQICPFIEEICTIEQCLDCATFNKLRK